ncbi:hypothetical protein Syun_001374 [Stephania yunnanensis]|uniref:Uncharacterized protein n=1 Tax=Stephania yunnanensis TaxID=152371 RepID=A0AAP0LJA1_9MAGN
MTNNERGLSGEDDACQANSRSLSLVTALSVTALSHGPSTALSPSQTLPPLDFRSVAEPIGRIQPSISTAPGSYFFLANCKGIDADEHVANEILSSFDVRLRQYAMRQLTKAMQGSYQRTLTVLTRIKNCTSENGLISKVRVCPIEGLGVTSLFVADAYGFQVPELEDKDYSCVLYEVNNGSETELLYSVSDPLIIRDGSETEYNNSISNPLLIRDGSETAYNNSVSDPLRIRDRLEMEYNNSVSDPLLIRDRSETEYNNFVFDPLLIRDGLETECNYNCTL